MIKNNKNQSNSIDKFSMKAVSDTNQYLNSILNEGDQYLTIEIADETKATELK